LAQIKISQTNRTTDHCTSVVCSCDGSKSFLAGGVPAISHSCTPASTISFNCSHNERCDVIKKTYSQSWQIDSLIYCIELLTEK